MATKSLLQKLGELSAVDCDTLDSDGKYRPPSAPMSHGSPVLMADSHEATSYQRHRGMMTDILAVAKSLGPFVDCTSNQVRHETRRLYCLRNRDGL